MEEIQQIQNEFLQSVDNRINDAQGYLDFRNGGSSSYLNIITSFNDHVQPFMQAILNDLQEMTAEKSRLCQDKENLAVENALFLDGINKFSNFISSIKGPIQQLYRIAKESCDLLKQSDSDVYNLNSQNIHLRTENEQLKRHIFSIKRNNEQMKQTLQKVLERQFAIENTPAIFQQLKEVIDKRNLNSAELNELNEKLTQKTERIGELEKENETNQEKINSLQQQIDLFKIQIEEKDSLTELLQSQIEVKSSKIEELEKTISDLKLENESLKEVIKGNEDEKNEVTNNEFEEIKNKLSHQSKQIEEFQQQIAEKDSNYETLMTEKTKFVNAAKHWKNKYETINHDEENIKIQALENEIKKHKEELATALTQIDENNSRYKDEIQMIREVYEEKLRQQLIKTIDPGDTEPLEPKDPPEINLPDTNVSHDLPVDNEGEEETNEKNIEDQEVHENEQHEDEMAADDFQNEEQTKPEAIVDLPQETEEQPQTEPVQEINVDNNNESNEIGSPNYNLYDMSDNAHNTYDDEQEGL